MNFLRQSTAAQGRTIGSMVDNTDGSSVENGLTIANTDIKLKKNGTTAVNKNSGGGTSDINGMYGVTFDATDTDTVGELNVSILVAGVLVAWKDFFVLTQAAYDLFFASGATGLITANLLQINGNVTPVTNLEDMFDGTGYLDETAPASRSQVGAIGTVSGSGLPFAVITDNTGGAIKGITFVGSQVGTFANTEAENGSYHVITHVGNAIDIVYQINIGGSRIAGNLDFHGILNSQNDVLDILAYDFITPGWDLIGTLDGQNSPDNMTKNPKLLSKHTGTGADLGNVLIRFEGSGLTSPVLNVDQLLADTSGATSAIGFLNGAVWLDTTGGGTSGTGEGVGFYNRPSDNITDVLAIAVANNLKIIHSLPGTSFILPSSVAGYEFNGFSYTITLNGKSVSGALMAHAIIVGNDSGTNAIPTVYDGCRMGSNTLGLHNLHNRCELGGDIILAEAGT